MTTLFFCLALLSGICGLGFLFAGMMGFAFHAEKPLPRWLSWLPESHYLAFIFRWKENPDAKRAMLTSAIFLIIAVLLVGAGVLFGV